MNRRRLDELAERLAALEAVIGETADAASLDTRLAAIEDAVRRLRYGDEELSEIDDTVRRCRELVGEHVAVGERVAVVSDGDPALLARYDRPVAAFPQGARAGSPDPDFDHGAAAIAHLEAQRVQGTRFLLLPEPARSWMQRYPEFAEHLLTRYDVVADEPGAGLLVDVGAVRAAGRGQGTLLEVLDRLVAGDRYAPVLDWTGLDLESVTGGRNLFAPSAEADGELPYLDRTIDVVVVEDPAHLDEGRRVASAAVVVVNPDQSGRVMVTRVEEVAPSGTLTLDPILLVVAVSDSGDPWLTRVQEAVADQPAITVVAARDPWARTADVEADVVVLAEPGVLPLPGCIEAAAATVTSDERVGAAAVKLLAADGSLEAAGSIVFADGSVEGVAAGCHEVAAPWHEYVRPVCAATGLLAVRSSAAREASKPSGSFVASSAGLWEAGYELRYQPDAWAVRALDPDPAGAGEEDGIEAWARTLSARPDRPVPLDTAAWRALLAQDDVQGCWR
jgi:hypothetical protein